MTKMQVVNLAERIAHTLEFVDSDGVLRTPEDSIHELAKLEKFDWVLLQEEFLFDKITEKQFIDQVTVYVENFKLARFCAETDHATVMGEIPERVKPTNESDFFNIEEKILHMIEITKSYNCVPKAIILGDMEYLELMTHKVYVLKDSNPGKDYYIFLGYPVKVAFGTTIAIEVENEDAHKSFNAIYRKSRINS